MIRNAFLLLSSSLFLVACSQGRTEEKTEPKPDASSPVETVLDEAAAPASIDIPALPDVVAKVDDIEITGADLAKLIDPMLKRYAASGAGDPRALAEATKHLRQEALDHLVLQRLLQREAAAKGVAVTDADLDAFFKDKLPPNVTLEQVAEQQGITVADIREQVSVGLTIEKYLEAVVADLPAATDDEAKAEYDKIAAENPNAFKKPETVQASHILVKVEKGADDATKAAARQKIDELRQKIVDGADFAEVAKENSDCPSGRRGGDLGSFGRGQMVKPFEEAAFALGTNEVSEVVETQFGFHVIKVTGKTPAGKTPLEEVRDQIAEHLSGEDKGKKVTELINELKSKAKVFINEALSKQPEPVIPEMDEEDLNAALEAVPASEPVSIESAPVEVKPAEETK